MQQKSPTKQKLFFVLTVLTLFFIGNLKSQAQNATGISLTWNIGVGCQTYSEDRKGVFLEEIADAECINVCQNSSVIYTLNGLPEGATIAWTVSGGTITAQTNNNVIVTWGIVGDAEISFVITTPTGLLTNKLCLAIIQGPKALFFVAPNPIDTREIKVCSNQLIYFTDASLTNGDSAIVNYHWDFGDGTTLDAQNPTHLYENPGWYEVTLTVTNSCNCSNRRAIKVYVDQQGFEISCASVACEGQTATYSLPPDASERCGGFKWSVIGGTIVGPNDQPTLDVLWDSADASGFGYVTFDPDQCDLECRIPTTIRIPVIQTNGTIEGSTSLCLGQQGRYSLPQWPTTDFQWQIQGNSGGTLGSIIQTDQRNEIIFTPTQAGTFTLVATYRNTLVHCGGTASITINVSRPEPFTGARVLCIGGSATYTTLSGNPVTWTLRNSSGVVVNTPSTSNTFTHPFAIAGNFTLTVSGPGICAGQVSNITVTPALSAPTISTPELIVCPNVPYSYAVLNPVANSIYEWQITNGTITSAANGPEVNVTFSSSGQIRVRRVQLSPAGCSSPFTVVDVTAVTINADVSNSPTNLVTPQIISCSNNYVTYKAINATGGLYTDAESTYIWSIVPATAGSIATGQNTNTVQVLWNNVTNAQNFTVVLQIKKCSATATVNKLITVTPIPAITISSPTTVCSGVSITFTALATPPLLPTSVIIWNFGNGPVNGAPGSLSMPQIFNNGTSANIAFTATATIVNANNCAGTITASQNFTVTPGPAASASNQTVINAFCGEADISATLLAATTSGATIIWYRNTTATQVGSGGVLQVTPTLGFGSYFFIATLNGCFTRSNNILITNICVNPTPCTISPTPVNSIAINRDCGRLIFTSTTSGTPLSRRWTLSGPGVSFSNVTDNNGPNQYQLNVLNAGQYNVILTVQYLSTTGTPCTVTTTATVTVPYLADFKVNPTCNDNGSYNIALTDNANFLNNVTNRQFQYEIGPSINGPWTMLANFSTNPNFNITNQAPGNYHFRQTVRGNVGHVLQDVCSKVISVNLIDMNGLFIDFLQPNCFDKAVDFSVPETLATNGDTYLWTFETVDNSAVTNTNQGPTRVFNANFAGTSVQVSVVVTTRFGCTRTLWATVNIPLRCFSGTIAATPATATVCKDNAVQLSYSSGNLPPECNIVSYRWMRNNVTVATTTANVYPATLPGIYTVELLSNTGCLYLSPNFIAPIFTPLPSLTLSGPTSLCDGDAASFSAATNATTLVWTVNGSINSAFNNQAFISLPNLPIGTHTVSVLVTANGCEQSASQTFQILPAPAQVAVLAPVLLDCQSYTVQLTAIASGAGTYNWSNGATGSTINVTQGGAYSVTFSNAGGCSTSAQVYVPRSPQAYMWVFPEGCYSKCKDEETYLLGPTFMFADWSWMLDGSPDVVGFNSIPTNYPLTQSGTYNMQLNTGLCDFVSPSMSLTAINCENCELDYTVLEVELTGDSLCSSTVMLEINSYYSSSFQATLVSNNNNLIVNPGGITIQYGSNIFNFVVIPINGFTGGPDQLSLVGTIVQDETIINCSTPIDLELRGCTPGQGRPAAKEKEAVQAVSGGTITLYPNPAHDRVNIRFETLQGDSQVEIYDMTGRMISSFNNKETQGIYELDLAPMATGVYVVILRQGGAVLMQRKLQVY